MQLYCRDTSVLHLAGRRNDLNPSATLRIILAPYADTGSAKILSALLIKLRVPSEFAAGRPCSVTHSIGSHESTGMITAWFHALSKNIQIKGEQSSSAGQNIVTRSHILQGRRGKQGRDSSPTVPGTDETWARLGYCLSVLSGSRCPTLVCFGAVRNVAERLEVFRGVCKAGSKVEREVMAEPYALFDMVVCGSFEYVDERVWRVCDYILLRRYGPGADRKKLKLTALRESSTHAKSLRRQPVSETISPCSTIAPSKSRTSVRQSKASSP